MPIIHLLNPLASRPDSILNTFFCLLADRRTAASLGDTQ